MAPARTLRIALAALAVLTLAGCTDAAAPTPATSRQAHPHALTGRQPAAGLVLVSSAASIPTWWKPQRQSHPNATGRTFSNFDADAGHTAGLILGDPNLRGSGVGRSTLTMRAHSSTEASAVPKTFPRTDQLSLVRLSSIVQVFAGFTVQGTKQGHIYNGLRIDQAKHLHMHDVRIADIPGDDDAPPGETFGLNDYKTDGSRYSRVEIDGGGVGAAGFGVNGSKNVTIRKSYSHDNRHSMGFAFWHVRNITMSRDIAANNGGAGFNFERVTGTVRLTQIVSVGNRYPISIASDQGSATYRIIDPRLSGGTLQIHLPKTYYGVKNKQRRSQIRLIIHGHDRSDLIRFS